MLAHPEDFYVKETKLYRSYFNYPETSHTPIHFNFTRQKLLDLHCHDLLYCLYTDVKEIQKSSHRLSLQQQRSAVQANNVTRCMVVGEIMLSSSRLQDLMPVIHSLRLRIRRQPEDDMSGFLQMHHRQ